MTTSIPSFHHIRSICSVCYRAGWLKLATFASRRFKVFPLGTYDGNPAAPIALTAAYGFRFPKTCSRLLFPETALSPGETGRRQALKNAGPGATHWPWRTGARLGPSRRPGSRKRLARRSSRTRNCATRSIRCGTVSATILAEACSRSGSTGIVGAASSSPRAGGIGSMTICSPRRIGTISTMTS